MAEIPPWFPRSQTLLGSPFLRPLPQPPPKRRAFISYFDGDGYWVDQFVKTFGSGGANTFIPRGIGITDADDFVHSYDPEYVMSRIREECLEDSSVTIVLVGRCTHSRRYVDWEIKSSLRQAGNEPPNGLLGIILPGASITTMLGGTTLPCCPDRLAKNINSGYAKWYHYPRSAENLRAWIEDACNARTSRSQVIVNPNEMMKYNARCLVCSQTH